MKPGLAVTARPARVERRRIATGGRIITPDSPKPSSLVLVLLGLAVTAGCTPGSGGGGAGNVNGNINVNDNGHANLNANGDANVNANVSPGGVPTCTVLPADNAWNTDISNYSLHPNSDAYIDSIGRYETLHPDFGTVWENEPIGIPYVLVSGGQPRVPVSFLYADESDPGPYPIPPEAPIEAGDDRHVIVLDDDNCVLYELFDASTADGGQSWNAGSGAIFHLDRNDLRPDYRTSADAAGLPIFPGLVRYDEVMEKGVIDHALRFTVEQTQAGFIHPATHFASQSTDPNLPPMGLRFRLKASYDCSAFSYEVRVICDGLKKYGMMVADNGGAWFITGAPDSRWNDEHLAELGEIPGDAFEAVDTGPIIN